MNSHPLHFHQSNQKQNLIFSQLVGVSGVCHIKWLKLWRTREISPLWDYRWVSALQIPYSFLTPCLTCQDTAFSFWIFLFGWFVMSACPKHNAAMRNDMSGDKPQGVVSHVNGLQPRWPEWFERKTAAVSLDKQIKSNSKSKVQLNRCVLKWTKLRPSCLYYPY